MTTECEICRDASKGELWRDRLCRVIRVDDEDHPVFYRVIAAEHVREMTDLEDSDRVHMMRVVFSVEAVVRKVAAPLKMNLAALGNVCPHVHWHVIARWEDDRHFPAPIWAAPKRDTSRRRFLAEALAELDKAVVASLNEFVFDNVTSEIRSRNLSTMPPQNYANHKRFIPIYHFVAFPILVINLLTAMFVTVVSFSFHYVLYLAMSFAFIVMFFAMRYMSLKVQDRLIRLEMRLRLKEILPAATAARVGELTIPQLVALRFAGDREMDGLVKKVLDEKIVDREAIKKMITDWQPDHDRC